MGDPPYDEDEQPTNWLVTSANPAALAAKRAARDSRSVATRATGIFACGTWVPQNGHEASLRLTCRAQDGQAVNRGLMTVLTSIVVQF